MRVNGARLAWVRRLAIVAAFFALSINVQAQGLSKNRAESDVLARAALSMALQALRTYGEFDPFGVGLAADTEVVALGSDKKSDLRHNLEEALKSGRVRATALVYPATLTRPTTHESSDAIAMQMTQRNGYSATLVYPYRFQGARVVSGEPYRLEQKRAPRAQTPKPQ